MTKGMSIHEEKRGQKTTWRVKWRDSESQQHSKIFKTIEQAEAFQKEVGPPKADPQKNPQTKKWDPKAYAERMTDRGKKPWIGGSQLLYDLPPRPSQLDKE